jgi:hypothetical protein
MKGQKNDNLKMISKLTADYILEHLSMNCTVVEGMFKDLLPITAAEANA